MDIDTMTIGFSHIMNWQAQKNWFNTGVWIPHASCSLTWLCLFFHNATDLKTTLTNCSSGSQDCLLILFPAIFDLTIELVPRLRCVLTGKSQVFFWTLDLQDLSIFDSLEHKPGSFRITRSTQRCFNYTLINLCTANKENQAGYPSKRA